MPSIETWILSHRLLVTVGVVGLVWLVRSLCIGAIRRRHVLLNEDQRKLIGTIRNTSSLLIVVSIVVLWLPQIQHFALSITAVAVAVVVATKELILCLTGTALRQLAKPFQIGDWIRVQDQFGEVIEESLLTTTLLEINAHTYTYSGRTLTIPNSQFLSSTITNQNIVKKYMFHQFRFVLEPGQFRSDLRTLFKRKIEEIFSEFSETARRYNAVLERRSGIDIPNPEPQVSVSTNDTAKVIITATLFCPTAEFERVSLSVSDAFYQVLEKPETL